MSVVPCGVPAAESTPWCLWCPVVCPLRSLLRGVLCPVVPYARCGVYSVVSVVPCGALCPLRGLLRGVCGALWCARRESTQCLGRFRQIYQTESAESDPFWEYVELRNRISRISRIRACKNLQGSCSNHLRVLRRGLTKHPEINEGGISGFWCLKSEKLVRGDKGGDIVGICWGWVFGSVLKNTVLSLEDSNPNRQDYSS